MRGTTRTNRRRVVVTGLGLLSPLGDDAAALHEALLEGRNGLRPLTSFDGERLAGLLGGVTEPLAGEIPEGPERYLGDRNLRPLDRTARLCAAAAELALGSSGLPEGRGGPGRAAAGLVLGTMFGSLRTISEFDRRALTAGPRYTKPFEFASSVINAAAGQAAISHGLTGINATVAGGSAAGVAALVHAADLIRMGRSQTLLAGGVEELCLESTWGLARAGRLCGSNGAGPRAVAIPFHARRGGFWTAEGAALLVLEDEESARRRGAPLRARVLGGGGAFDPSRGRDPEAGSEAVRRAVVAGLDDAEIGPEKVDCASLSANGSRRLDAMEAAGVAAALGKRAARLPVTAVKGALGESLGAGGALQAAVAVESLACGCLPGIPGLDEPESGSPLRPALEAAAAGPYQGRLRRALVTALAWDGPVWALILEVP